MSLNALKLIGWRLIAAAAAAAVVVLDMCG